MKKAITNIAYISLVIGANTIGVMGIELVKKLVVK